VFVGEDHGLDAVADAELGEDALGVRLDGGFLDDERGGDLAVRQAASDEQLTLYKSVGSALQDVGLARHIYDEATKRGVGTSIPDFLAAKAL
jgi:hypothetical protein